MVLPTIKRIVSARHMDGNYWEVGEEIEHKSGLIITEIKDMTAEFESSIHSQYDIFVNGQLFESLVNMPVQVIYEMEDKTCGKI